jgi:methyltransferase (TIGR00027 family)
MLAIRTRNIDDWLEEGSRPQVVNLGAGMCTRPYRLKLNAIIYEVENDASLLQAKRAALADQEMITTAVDVTADVTSIELKDALLQAGFDPKLPTDWIAEGLLEYLTVQAQQDLMALTASLSAPGSRFLAWNGDPWAVEFVRNFLNVHFPHIGAQSVQDTCASLKTAGWSQNVTVMDDELFWERYRRVMGIPVYMISVEKGESSSKEEL